MQNLNQEVTIIADDMGNVIRQSQNNSEFGHIRLVQDRITINNGFVNKKPVSTLLHGQMEVLQSLGWDSTTKPGGRIVVLESFEGDDRNLKLAGQTGVICKSVDRETGEERNIYRTTKFKSDPNAQDTFIDHTNADEIRTANGVTVNNETMTQTPDQAFVESVEDVEEEVEEVVDDNNQVEVEDLEKEFSL
tara:strand:- start:2105 stop:2677 length:573 start_codon:yes stop_codon:yes gene_type:complete